MCTKGEENIYTSLKKVPLFRKKFVGHSSRVQ